MRKYKLFGKIPIFDLVIILVVLVVAVVGIKIINTSKSGQSYIATETKDIVFTVVFNNISSQIICEPEIGEKVIDNLTNNNLGSVISVKTEPYVAYDYSNITGEVVTSTLEGRKNMTIEIAATATVSDVCTEINGVKIGIGKNMTFSMPSVCANGYITNIVEAGE